MTISLEKYTGLIFDMDGTLLDTMPSHIKAWNKTAQHFEFDFDSVWLHSLGGMPSYKIAAEINKQQNLVLDTQRVSEYKMQAFRDLDEKGNKIPCTYDLLINNYRHKKLAVGTGSQRVSATSLLTHHHIIDKLDALVTATDVMEHKPQPETFLKAAEQMDLGSDQCVVFEDTELGKRAAHAAKMDCIMVVDGERLELHPWIKGS